MRGVRDVRAQNRIKRIPGWCSPRGAHNQTERALSGHGVCSTSARDFRPAELLVTIRGCHREPCGIMLNVTRLGRDAFERDLREKFGDALASHLDPDATSSRGPAVH